MCRGQGRKGEPRGGSGERSEPPLTEPAIALFHTVVTWYAALNENFEIRRSDADESRADTARRAAAGPQRTG